jgi:mono/diheme cytochrome c family protein
LKKTYTKVALGLVAAAFLFAIASFLSENWSANESPGMLETFLAKWALSRARKSQGQTPNPLPPTEENLLEGRQIYEKQCAFCHGLDGRGETKDQTQGRTGVQFYPPVPSLIDRENELADGQIHSIVTKGVRYTAMPSFAKALTAEEIWKVVLWVRHLPQMPPQAPQDPAPETKKQGP